MKEYTVDELLEAREKRVALIEKLLKRYNTPLLLIRVNYPGLKKMNNLTLQITQDMSHLICTRLGAKVCGKVLLHGAEGPIVCVAVEEDVLALKTVAVDFEGKHCLGRCLDLDVYDLEGRCLGRQELGYPSRKCYLCEDDAHHCVRSKRHSEQEVIAFIEARYREYLEVKRI